MKNPCYNEQTKTDCPLRNKGCSITCPYWKDYVTERNAEYEQKRIAKQGITWTMGSESRQTREIKRTHKYGGKTNYGRD